MKDKKIEQIICREIEQRGNIGVEPISIYISGKKLPRRIETEEFEAIRHPHNQCGATYLIGMKTYA